MITYHLSLLQLENYELKRFWRIVLRRYFPPRALRNSPVWTIKMKAITGLTILLITISALYVFILGDAFWGIIAVFGGIALFPIYLTVAVVAFIPLDALLKRRLITQAKRKLALFPNVKIVGIAGSYGKTTMKEALAVILAEKYDVLATPGNINTPVGIARMVLEKLTARTEVIIVEMGEYDIGDIAALCAIVPPDVSVLTGINEAHLERFGTLERTVMAITEIMDYAKDGAFVAVNGDDANVINAYGAHARGRKIATYGSNAGNSRLDYALEGSVRFSGDGLEQSFTIRGKGETAYETNTNLLGAYATGTIAGAIAVAERMGLSHSEILRGIAMIRPVPHRLEPFVASGNVLVIDDSYNGNPAGAREAIDVLGRFTGRRKIYCTPGLVEMGVSGKVVHETIGAKLAKNADLVILIHTSVSRHIKNGLLSAGFPAENIVEFPTAQAAHTALPGILRSGDVILFQNDWPDNYF